MQLAYRHSYHVILLLCCLCLLPEKIYAQSDEANYIISKKSFSVENELASREVFCGLQDKDGFLWFGTRNGLNRFDGQKFKLFTKQNSSMFDNKVVHLALDDQNRLYIHYGLPGWQYAFNGRIDVMDLKTQKIEPLSKTIPQLPFNEKDICKIISDKTGKLYFIVANPFRCFSYSSGNGFRLICEMNKWKNVKHNINEF